MKTNNEILVLPSWYPNRLDSFAGDFVKRHVEAIASVHKQHVFCIVKDDQGRVTKDVLETAEVFENYSEIIVYYHIKKSGIRTIDKLRSDRKYTGLYKKYLRKYIDEFGIPALSHVHVTMKAGLAALWLKAKYNVPFVVTEHWSGFLPEASPHLSQHNFVFRKRIKKILSKADAVTAVSTHLGICIRSVLPNVSPVVIPNVVDTSIFYPILKTGQGKTRFIHASTMNHAKNIEGILKALRILKETGYVFTADFFGPVQKDMEKLIALESLQDVVSLKGDVSQTELASEMQNANAFILFSRFETFSCVVIEANAAGIPVFASDIPALRELISDNKNGYIVPADDSKALAFRLMDFIDGKLPVDKKLISASTDKFSYQAVAKQFSKVYSDIIN